MASISERIAAKIAQPAEPPTTNKHELDYYQNAEGWKPTATVTLADLIAAIQSEEFAGKVGRVRGMIDAGNKKEADTLKKTLPAISASGFITTGRRKGAADEGRFAHSGLLQIDLDAKDNPTWTVERMVEALQSDPHVQAGFITPSGQGVKGLARIPADPATHKAAFLAAENHFATLGLSIDKSCKDPVRLCFVSHDPDAWLRPDEAEAFAPLPDETPVVPELPGGYHFAESFDDEPSDQPAPSFRMSGSGGIVIRGNDFVREELTLDDIRGMLALIPYPGYDEWLKIANAVWKTVGEAGTAVLQEWAPEKKPGDYAEKFAHRLSDVNTGTLVMMAQKHGWARTVTSLSAPRAPSPAPDSDIGIPASKAADEKRDKNAIPLHVFPVPAAEIGHDLSSRHIFSIIGPSNRLFMRGTTVHEVAQEPTGDFALLPVSPDRFASVVESFGPRVMRLEKREDGTARWRSTVFPVSHAKIALSSDGARECLPTIRQLVSAPVLIPDSDTTGTVIPRGYHPHAGGTFVTSGELPPIVPLDEAKSLILMLLEDFDFPDGGDASRAIASMLSPAMKIGGWIEDDFPLDIAEADQSQSGKTFRQKLICSIYRESPSAITQAAGGVGSLDERVSTALITGRPFISFDNFRGRMDSQILETAIRGLGKVSARALRVAADIDCTPFLWQLSTNGAELTRDLANRSIITRIRKRPNEHVFRTYPEGDINAHVRHHQPKFLGAVHAIIREWARHNRPMTNESRHDFRVWCRCMDWIVQNIFDFPPLLNGHREEQMRTSNPKLQWLRDITHALMTDGYDGRALTASDLAEAAEEHDLPLPGRRDTTEALEVRVGKLLGRLFKETGDNTLTVDGRQFTRVAEHEYDPINRTHRDRKTYVIERMPS